MRRPRACGPGVWYIPGMAKTTNLGAGGRSVCGLAVCGLMAACLAAEPGPGEASKAEPRKPGALERAQKAPDLSLIHI